MSDSLQRAAYNFVWAMIRRGYTPAIAGHPDGSMKAPRAREIYVRIGAQGNTTVTTALRGNIALRWGQPVLLRQENGKYVVDRVDDIRMQIYDPNGTGGVPWHTHNRGSGLEYAIDPEMLAQGRVTWDPTNEAMYVYIFPFWYETDSGLVYWSGGSIDLSSYQPATAGQWCWVLVGVDPATNTAVAAAGTEQSTLVPLDVADIGDIDFTGYIPCGAVKVKESDTDLSDIRRYVDAHAWFNPAGSGRTAPLSVVASEALSAGDLVNLWNDGGTLKTRQADAAAGYATQGYVLAAVILGGDALVYSLGANDQLSGLTPGATLYLSTTAGEVTETAPSGSGELVQEVGVAISATEMLFSSKQGIILD